ncbi:hypothetical protein F4804DRAFT_324803 [Jackrogersella minutella]|nr:hypothetical protein F4804DRAFT_324803 [Jackrogersella minutella]
MFTPSNTPYTSHIYPIGNTPAVSLTRSLPQGIDADLLLLGCGDVRNILFTLYTERGFPPRKLDITCCDTEAAIIARNVLLFTLLIDGTNADSLWDIYYHLRISEESMTFIKNQARKIVSLSSSIEQWSEERYGSMLRFCDATSLQYVRKVWMKYALPQPLNKISFEKRLERIRELRRTLTGKRAGEPVGMFTGVRSASPLLLASMEEIPKVNDYFWKYGTLSRKRNTTPNPMFSEILSVNTWLHFGTDPIQGFHLAAGLTKLAPTSPLRPNKNDEVFNVVGAAKAQFREWVAAFQDTPGNRITIRFAVSDALSFSHGLQMTSTSENKLTNIFRRPFDVTAVEFDPAAYAGTKLAPTKFDAIDTSNLVDVVGTLNVIIAAMPLLKPSASSTLWIETMAKTEGTGKRKLDTLLRGHTPTLSLLLGISPVDYWTNATSTSWVDQVLLNELAPSTSTTQVQSRYALKLAQPFSHSPDDHELLHVEPNALAEAVFQIYSQMFVNDNLEFVKLSLEDVEKRLRIEECPFFHRGSFVALVKHIQTRTSTDWPFFWRRLLQLIDHDAAKTSIMRTVYRQELGTMLHLQGLHTEQGLGGEVSEEPGLGSFHSWSSMPEVVCITVVVPREKVDNLYSTDISRLRVPTLEGMVRYKSLPSKLLQLACVHLTFGHVETLGDHEADDFSIVVHQDPIGWQGKSPLVASFYVPSSALVEFEPNDAIVGLGVSTSIFSFAIFGHLQPTMAVHMTTLSDTANVFVTKYGPGMSGYPLSRGKPEPVAGNSTTQAGVAITTQITANFEVNEIESLCAHVDFSSSPQGMELLAECVPIKLQQYSPFSIDIVFGENALVYPISFPAPIQKETAKMRIARIQGCIEVIAPLADPLTSESLLPFIYPATLGEGSVPITFNSQHINLDSLPILDVDQSHRKDYQWLAALTYFQLSTRERRLLTAGSPSLRIKFKQSLRTMVNVASGLQGRHIRPLVLEHPEKGAQMFIFIHAVRLNAAEGSVVVDAAVIPITIQMARSRKFIKLLNKTPEAQVCTLQVDDEELILWKHILPSLAERCRTWSHGPQCEYKRANATIPLSTKMREQFMCSCGKGKLPESFANLPEWDGLIYDEAVRVAISPTFSVPSVEDIVDIDPPKTQDGLDGVDKRHTSKRWNNTATQAKNGTSLLKSGDYFTTWTTNNCGGVRRLCTARLSTGKMTGRSVGWSVGHRTVHTLLFGLRNILKK